MAPMLKKIVARYCDNSLFNLNLDIKEKGYSIEDLDLGNSRITGSNLKSTFDKGIIPNTLSMGLLPTSFAYS